MSDRRETQEKPLIILRNAQDYPTWKPYTISRLQQQSCNWSIVGKPQPDLQSVQATLIEDGFAAEDLRPSMLAAALRDDKKDYLVTLTKSAGIIQELVDKSLHPLIHNKTAAEMWAILEERFQHISPMSVSRVLVDACNVKLSDCKDVVDYTSRYQVTFDKLLSLINKESWMSRKSVEMTLQGSLLRNLGKGYSALVSAIETSWTDKTTNLSDTILRIIRHAEINKGNEEDTAENPHKVLATRTPQTPRGTCTTQECIDQGITTHFPDRCWIKHPELRAKYSLRQMRTRGSKRSLRKAANPAEPERKETLASPEIES